MIVNSSGSTFVSMPDIPLNLSTLEVSEELLCRPPEQRKEDDILGILPWIRHKSSLFKNLEDDMLVYVIKHVEFIKIKKDHVIVRQGDEGNCFYVILKGSVSVYARKDDEHHGDFLPHHDIGAVRSTQERLAYFGTELGSLKSGRSFGEMVLMSDNRERNASVIADELTELIVINEELYKKSFQVHNREWKEKSSFVLTCPIFISWPEALKALLIENLKMHKINFGNRFVEQGSPCNSVYFIAKGAAKVLSDPRKCKEQYEALNPIKAAKKREKNLRDDEENIQLNAMDDLVRPLTVIERRRRRIEHGFVAMETRFRRREIQATTIGPNDIIGDVEMVLDIPEYCSSVECVETLEVYELDKASFQRLVGRRSPETLELLQKVVITKLKLRVERLNEILLFKYLFERATALPRGEKMKTLKKKQNKLVELKPFSNRWQGQGKPVKGGIFRGGQATKQSDIKSKQDSIEDAVSKGREQRTSEKKRRERKRSERKEYTAEDFRALKKKMQAQGKMIGRVSD